MSHAMDTHFHIEPESAAPGALKRAAVLLYGVLSYSIGVAGLIWFILAMSGLAPVGFGPLQTASVGAAIGVNLGLILLFGLQHTVMARANFKSWLKQKIPAAAERSTYVLASGLLTVLVLALWQPLPGVVWDIQQPGLSIALWIAYACAWAYLFIATFVTNHFELMGLRQVYLYFRNKPHSTLPFTRKLMYRYSRHPMMLGFLVGMWAVPVMSATHFTIASLFSLYIAVGVFFEERDLLKQFGETYRQYKKDVAVFLPRLY